MRSTAKTVDEYLQEIPEERREAVSDLRARIKRLAPEAEESIQYGMPTWSMGDILFCVASQKQYVSLYVDPTLLEAYRPKLGKLNLGKGCIRFRHLKDLPMDVVEEMMHEAVEARRERVGV